MVFCLLFGCWCVGSGSVCSRGVGCWCGCSVVILVVLILWAFVLVCLYWLLWYGFDWCVWMDFLQIVDDYFVVCFQVVGDDLFCIG